jgi:hypothetical protein
MKKMTKQEEEIKKIADLKNKFNNDKSKEEAINEIADFLIKKATDLCGEKDKSWKYTGIELYGEQPEIWYPDSPEKEIKIRLTEGVKKDIKILIHQLAHEVCHLISPSGEKRTNNLDEGLATVFSKRMVVKFTGDSEYSESVIEKECNRKYKMPYERVNELLDLDKKIIKKLREIQPIIFNITINDFKRVETDKLITNDLINYLLTDF